MLRGVLVCAVRPLSPLTCPSGRNGGCSGMTTALDGQLTAQLNRDLCPGKSASAARGT